MTTIEEFYNKVHAKKDGKFAETPGPGHAKGVPASKRDPAALKKVLAKPKTKAGSVIVANKTAALKATDSKKSVPKATPAPKKAVPGSGSDGVLPPVHPSKAAAVQAQLIKMGYTKVFGVTAGKDGKWNVFGEDKVYSIKPGADIATAMKGEFRKGAPAKEGKPGKVTLDRMTSVRLGNQKAIELNAFGSREALGAGSPPAPRGMSEHAAVSDRALAGLLAYRGQSHADINTALRGLPGPKKPLLDDDQVDAAIAGLDDAFKTAPATTQDIVVYREFSGGTIPGGGAKFKDDAFVSTTWGENWTKDKPASIKIVIPKGTKAITISKFEEELLLPRGGTFTPQKDGSYLFKAP